MGGAAQMSSSAEGGLTYEKAGVVGLGKEKSSNHFELLKQTRALFQNKIIETPFGSLYEASPGVFHSKNCDGVGTKTLLAQLAGKHDTIGIDAVAMVANDCIRTGARPVALTNTIDAPNPSAELVSEILKGIAEGARQAECAVVGGETASLPDVFADGYTINCDCAGQVDEDKIISGNGLRQGDAVIGLRSAGLHSNGISLARKALFKKWGGKYDAWEKPDGMERELVLEVLEPTKIYVKKILGLVDEIPVKALVHVTGDAYKKFGVLQKSNPGIGFEFNNFSPQPIFKLIQQAGGVSDEEMFKRFNMGWGFAAIVAKEDAGDAVQKLGEGAERIGNVTDSAKIMVYHAGKKITLD